MLTAMVLAAGLGTRLRPLTDELPKPLVPVGDRSVLGHAAGALVRAGFERLVVNTHHLPERYDAEALELGVPVELSHEDDIRGTAGGVAHAAGLLAAGELLVHNGDILAELDIGALRAAHAAARPFATLAVAAGLPAGAGPVGLDAEGRVVRLRDVRVGDERAGAEFAGVQVLSAEARACLPSHGCLVGDVYIPALLRGACVLGAAVVKAYADIGTLEAYLAANLAWLRQRGLASYLAPGASRYAGVVVIDSVVGAGARLTGAGAPTRTVVWPGAVAKAPLEDAIVTPRGVVRVTPAGTAAPR
jgi:mannose-1-phosphate guanylyltransferase